MKRLLVTLAALVTVACGGDDNRNAGDPTPGDPIATGDPTGDPNSGDPRPGDSGGDPGVNVPDWAILHFPKAHTGEPGTAFDVYGRVYEAGRTEGAGQGGGIVAAVGVGLASDAVGDWTWTVALYNVDATNDDEYRATVTLPSTPGTYRYAYRFRVDGGPWLYADGDGSANGFDLAEAGALTVEDLPAPLVDWCQLMSPSSIELGPGEASGPITAKVWEPGVTDSVDPSGVVGQVGIGADGADPSGWTWVDASFDSHVVNDDVHTGTLNAPSAAGVYDYAFRFRLVAGSGWVICDLDGSTNGYSPDQAGELTVVAAEVDWARVMVPPDTTTVIPGQTVRARARVYEAGVTEGVGDGGVAVELGVAADGTAPAGSWTFFAASYAGDLDGEGGGPANADDLFVGWLLAPGSAGSYDIAARARLASEPWLFADAGGSNATDDLYDAADARTLTVVGLPPNGAVSWCRIQWPTAPATAAPGATVGPVYGRVLAVAGATPTGTTGATGTGPTPRSQVGVGARDTDPASDGSWTWSDGAFNLYDGDVNDEHEAILVAPGTTGDYDWALRFSMDDGATWTYCDLDSTDNGYATAQAGKLTVQ